MQVLDLPLGFDPARIDAKHAHAEIDAFRTERARERHQRRIAAGTRDEFGPIALAGEADDVDDNARTALAHARINLAREVDVTEDLQVPGPPPRVRTDLIDPRPADRAGIVDDDIDVAACPAQREHGVGSAQVARMAYHLDRMAVGQAFPRALQILLAARCDMDPASFGCKACGAGKADAL